MRDGDRRARIVLCTAGYVVFERGVRHYRLLIVSRESQFYHSYHLYHPFISQENHSNSNAQMHTHSILEYQHSNTTLEHRYLRALISSSSANNHSLASFTHLIIDEVHERSVDTDLLLYFAKEMLRRDKDFKVILMSATLCSSTYSIL